MLTTMGQLADVIIRAMKLIKETHKVTPRSNIRILKANRDKFNDDEWVYLMSNIDSRSNLFCYGCENCRNCFCCFFCHDCIGCKDCFRKVNLSYTVGADNEEDSLAWTYVNYTYYCPYPYPYHDPKDELYLF